MRGPVSGLFFVLSILHAGLQSPALSSTISLMKNTRILTILMLVFLLALTVVLAMVPAPYSTYIAMAYPALLVVVGTVIFIGAAVSVLLAVLIPLCLYFLFCAVLRFSPHNKIPPFIDWRDLSFSRVYFSGIVS